MSDSTSLPPSEGGGDHEHDPTEPMDSEWAALDGRAAFRRELETQFAVVTQVLRHELGEVLRTLEAHDRLLTDLGRQLANLEQRLGETRPREPDPGKSRERPHVEPKDSTSALVEPPASDSDWLPRRHEDESAGQRMIREARPVRPLEWDTSRTSREDPDPEDRRETGPSTDPDFARPTTFAPRTEEETPTDSSEDRTPAVSGWSPPKGLIPGCVLFLVLIVLLVAGFLYLMISSTNASERRGLSPAGPEGSASYQTTETPTFRLRSPVDPGH